MTPTATNPSKSRAFWALLFGVLITLALLTLSLFIGVYDLSSEGGREIFFITRLPRTISLMLAGSALAMSGLVMQLMTQNRFVEPTTTGTIEWAGLGLLLTMVFWPTPSLVERMIGAVLFSFLGTLVFFLFLRRVTLKSSLIVPIIGIMLGAVVSSFTTFLALQFNLLQNLGIWFTGSFTSAIRGQYELIWILLLAAITVFIVADQFTVAGLGKEVATGIGLNYQRVVLLGVGIVAVVTGTTAVVIGALPFLGLIVPNVVSMFRGDNLRSNLPWVCMVGIWVITVCDIIGRTIIMPFEVPVSVILGIVGAVVFVIILVRRRRVS